MTWLNEYEIKDAYLRFEDDPILGPACGTLLLLMDWTNSNSDGWPYWRKPANAAEKLMELVESARLYGGPAMEARDFTAEEVTRAYRPIKAFLTRQGVPHAQIIVAVKP